MANAPQDGSKRRTRVDPRRAATHARIVEATAELIYEGGSGSLTKAAICKRAGIHASAIYAYFDDVDACVEAAAQDIVAKFSERDHALRRQRDPAAGLVGTNLRRTIERARATLESYGTDLTFLMLVLRCRHEDSPMGRGIRASLDATVQAVARELWLSAVDSGLRSDDFQRFELLAWFIMDVYMAGAARLASDGGPELDAIAESIGMTTYYAVGGVIGQLLRQQAEADGAPQPTEG